MTKEEKANQKKVEKLSDLVQAAFDALREARRYASENALSFDWTPARGFGGDYYGKGNEEYDPRDHYTYYEEDEYGGHWRSSSQGC
jgi:hypothetical protein